MRTCVFTGKETEDKTNNIPVHREARPMLDSIHRKFNERVMGAFIEEQQELQGEKAMSEELLRKIAPQYNKSQVLRMIQREGVEGIFEALERASQKAYGNVDTEELDQMIEEDKKLLQDLAGNSGEVKE